MIPDIKGLPKNLKLSYVFNTLRQSFGVIAFEIKVKMIFFVIVAICNNDLVNIFRNKKGK